MTSDTTIPRRIYALWLQGEDNAPPLVQMCLRRWRRLNPDYTLIVLDRLAVNEILRELPVRTFQLQPQALSDILRIKLMSDHGGVWVDATTFPIRPLRLWLPEAAKSGFFAFEGYREPLEVDSWFLAAAPDHIIARSWWNLVQEYWRKPRRLLALHGEDWLFNYNFDPLSFFGAEDVYERDSYPYYWFMYMFSHLRHTSEDFRLAWDRVDRKPGSDCHRLQNLCDENPQISDLDLVAAGLASDVQKLSYKDFHARRWLSLDGAFQDLDRQTLQADFDAYPVFEVSAGKPRVRVSTWLRDKGDQIRYAFLWSKPGRRLTSQR